MRLESCVMKKVLTYKYSSLQGMLSHINEMKNYDCENVRVKELRADFVEITHENVIKKEEL